MVTEEELIVFCYRLFSHSTLLMIVYFNRCDW